MRILAFTVVVGLLLVGCSELQKAQLEGKTVCCADCMTFYSNQVVMHEQSSWTSPIIYESDNTFILTGNHPMATSYRYSIAGSNITLTYIEKGQSETVTCRLYDAGDDSWQKKKEAAYGTVEAAEPMTPKQALPALGTKAPEAVAAPVAQPDRPAERSPGIDERRRLENEAFDHEADRRLNEWLREVQELGPKPQTGTQDPVREPKARDEFELGDDDTIRR